MSTADPDWFEDFFDEDYLRFAADRYPAEATAAEVEFLIEALALGPGTRVLDLACGHGRHSVELARHGCAVTGVDLSEPSLALAAARAAEAGVDLRLERADMRRIAFDAEFDAVINMFTAFGYFARRGRQPARPGAGVRGARARRGVPARDDQPGLGLRRASRRAAGTSSRTGR